jgi:phosphate transport system protein
VGERERVGPSVQLLCVRDGSDRGGGRYADLARQITKWDYEIDGLYVKARDKLLKIIIERPEVINEGTALLMVNRHLERIGDHICNICESIVYIVEGTREHLN